MNIFNFRHSFCLYIITLFFASATAQNSSFWKRDSLLHNISLTSFVTETATSLTSEVARDSFGEGMFELFVAMSRAPQADIFVAESILNGGGNFIQNTKYPIKCINKFLVKANFRSYFTQRFAFTPQVLSQDSFNFSSTSSLKIDYALSSFNNKFIFLFIGSANFLLGNKDFINELNPGSNDLRYFQLEMNMILKDTFSIGINFTNRLKKSPSNIQPIDIRFSYIM